MILISSKTVLNLSRMFILYFLKIISTTKHENRKSKNRKSSMYEVLNEIMQFRFLFSLMNVLVFKNQVNFLIDELAQKLQTSMCFEF